MTRQENIEDMREAIEELFHVSEADFVKVIRAMGQTGGSFTTVAKALKYLAHCGTGEILMTEDAENRIKRIRKLRFDK